MLMLPHSSASRTVLAAQRYHSHGRGCVPPLVYLGLIAIVMQEMANPTWQGHVVALLSRR